ncbi:uncharacterized protein LOC120695174 [Panicum virgatum]|uniref:uncharacterized protein LOC120695174 n=1 Tax=Panicum virgatum TaxID=38727 RepID=UPI0019D693C7|nr:uncharacterized protein LOC120695174 [Panicum virgatum]
MVLTKRPWGSEGDSNIRDRVSLETSNAWNPGDCCSTNFDLVRSAPARVKVLRAFTAPEPRLAVSSPSSYASSNSFHCRSMDKVEFDDVTDRLLLRVMNGTKGFICSEYTWDPVANECVQPFIINARSDLHLEISSTQVKERIVHLQEKFRQHKRGEANFGANIDIAEKVFGDQIDSLPPSLEIDAPRLSIPLYEHRKHYYRFGLLSRKYGEIEMGQRAIKKILNLEKVSGGDFAVLSNMFNELGWFSDAEQVRKLVDERKTVKVPGLALVGEIRQLV